MAFKQKVCFRTLWHIRSFFRHLQKLFQCLKKKVTKQDKEFVESPGQPDLSDGLPKLRKHR